MTWKTNYRSFYYVNAPEPGDLVLPEGETALLSIDVQNTYMIPSDDPVERDRWKPFHDRMRDIVIPATIKLQNCFRQHDMDVVHARIACLLENGKDRSLSQKKPGWNYLLLPKGY